MIGFVQYATQLPAVLVGAHMAGACLVWLGALAVLYATRTRSGVAALVPPAAGSPEDSVLGASARS